jgi:hypothetical protein
MAARPWMFEHDAEGPGVGAHRSLILLALLTVGCATATTPGGIAPPATPVARAGADAIERPLPRAVPQDPAFLAAVEAGTRTPTGEPGPEYWQNGATYTLTARLDTEQRRLDASGRIVFRNHSPDTLTNLHLELTQNFHRAGVVRHEEAEVTSGVELRRVEVDGVALTGDGAGPRYQVFGTRLVILPPRAVLPGDSAQIVIDWDFTLPQAGAGERMGYHDDLFFLAYWYPQMTVYDDVIGWHPDPFTGITEFYAGFADYDLTIDAPAGWVVMATGELTNAEQVLAPAVLQRWQQAQQSDEPVRVLSAADAAVATTAGSGGRVRWRFTANGVRDVAFSATRAANWDAMRTPVGDVNGDGRTDHTTINAFWRESAPLWSDVAHYTAHAISFFSHDLAMPYPWPHMTSVEGGGIIGGGMEFPMMTLMGDYNQRGPEELYYVTAHEVAHMWIPMIVSTDERRYSWIDEGTTTFNEGRARTDFMPDRNHHLDDMDFYVRWALGGDEGKIMRRSAYHYSLPAYGVASYFKPATALVALRGVLGEETFLRGLRQFVRDWQYRHPYPWDFWNTFERVSDRDLSWFWSSWYFETWLLDQAIASAQIDGDVLRILIEDRGEKPMPVHLAVTREDGSVERLVVPVDVWLAGARTAMAEVASSPRVVRIEIDPDLHFADVDRTNNVWPRR